MRTSLDGQPCDFNATSAAEAIDRASTMVADAGRLVIQIAVDNRALTEAEIANRADLSESVQHIEITSLEPQQLLAKTLALGAETIQAAGDLFAQAAASIQSGAVNEAAAPLSEGLALWQAIDENLLQDSLPLTIQRHPELIAQEEFDALIADLQAALGTIQRGLAEKDLAAVSDTLLYEFPMTAGKWTAFLARTTEALETAGSSPSTATKENA